MNPRNNLSPDSLKELLSCLEDLSASRIFLVSGKSSFQSSGSAKKLEPVMANYTVFRFQDFESNPRIEDIHQGVELFKQFDPDTVIAVGGGSVIDMAKIVNFWAVNGVRSGEFFDGRKDAAVKGRPLIAIPTTAGSGSEATRFATMYVGKTKHSVENDGILPDYVFLDPALTMSLSPATTASSGIDALAHSMESYWSIRSTQTSKEYAAGAIELILPNLAKAVHSPDTETRTALLRGAHLAGKAIDLTRTTAAHALSYPLTSYFKIPHGHAAAMFLSELLQYNAGVKNSDVLDPRGVEYVRKTINELSALFGADNVAETREKIDCLMDQIGLETRLGQLGLMEKDIETIIAAGYNPDRAGNNPRRLTREAMSEMLLHIL